MSTRPDTVFGRPSTSGVSEAWFESLSKAEPSFNDQASVRSSINSSQSTFRRGTSFGVGGQRNQSSMSTADRLPLEFVASQGPQNLRALAGNAVVNFTLTGTGTLQPAALHLPSPASQPDRTRYTSLLKEYGDNVGERPTYNEDELGNSRNPLFRCEVRLRGAAAVAQAQSKKLARAEASYMVCQQLGLQLP